jgi:hypothetical protein
MEEGRHGDALALYREAARRGRRSAAEVPPPRAGDPCKDAPCEDAPCEDAPCEDATCGDALYGAGAALLAMGRWGAAHRAWADGAADPRARSHPALRAQAAKDSAYFPHASCRRLRDCVAHEAAKFRRVDRSVQGDGADRDPRKWDPREWDPRKRLAAFRGAPTVRVPPGIFLAEGVLSARECRRAIEAAEAHCSARSGGWTTSRHYAVPTTDVPVAEVPALLPWFNALLEDRLMPMLAEQFGVPPLGVPPGGRGPHTPPDASSACPGAGAGRLRVHDAFVVKYHEGAQRHLPLHLDQSHISLTIALNAHESAGDSEDDMPCYEGGGTFFCDLGRSVRVGRGSVLSFDGGRLHGGDPLTGGTRYIIAAFLYVLEDDPGQALDREGGAGRRGTKRAREAPADVEENENASRGRAVLEFDSSAPFSFGF